MTDKLTHAAAREIARKFLADTYGRDDNPARLEGCLPAGWHFPFGQGKPHPFIDSMTVASVAATVRDHAERA